MTLPAAEEYTRRGYLRRLVAVGGTAALAACVELEPGEDAVPTGDPDSRPQSQHAWNDVLQEDSDGNLLLPEHHVLLPLDLETDPDEDAREQVEGAFRSLERAYEFSPEGLLFTVNYSPTYFERLDQSPPVPHPEPLTGIEGDIDLDAADALVHLASDSPEVVLEAEQTLLGNEPEPNGIAAETDLTGVLTASGPRRTGFIGEGLPVEMAEEEGIDLPEELHENAPFFMGFRSGFSEAQAPESRATIEDGPYEGGSTMHIESLDLNLRQWFEQDDHFLRVAQMFSPEHAQEELVGEIGERLEQSTGVAGEIADRTADDARSEGLVGHAQKAARARDGDGTPPLLRRDFNTLDGDSTGVHFLSHQRTIDDFIRVREAMAGEDLSLGRRLNNGILQYIFVRSRGNYLTPPRDKRALPTERGIE